MGVKVMSISSSPVFATPNLGLQFWNFSTWLEATEAVAMYVHVSYS